TLIEGLVGGGSRLFRPLLKSCFILDCAFVAPRSLYHLQLLLPPPCDTNNLSLALSHPHLRLHHPKPRPIAVSTSIAQRPRAPSTLAPGYGALPAIHRATQRRSDFSTPGLPAPWPPQPLSTTSSR